jgi:Type IV secretory system Conjugative DNA transfer
MYLQINNILIPIYFLIIPVIVIFLSFFIFFKILAKNKLGSAFSLQLLKIRVPRVISSKNEESTREDNQEKIKEQIATIENLYSTLGGLKAQRGWNSFWGARNDHFSFEIVSHQGQIYFYIGIPKNNVHFFQERIQAVYPDAEIEEIQDYNIFSPQDTVIGARMILKEGFIFPLKTYKTIEIDPLDSLMNSLTKLSKEDGAVIQIIARSAHRKWHTKSSLFTKTVSRGKSIAYAKKNSGMRGLGGLFSVWFGSFGQFFETIKKDAPLKKDENVQLSQMENEMIKGVEEKNSKAGLDINIRIIVSSHNEAFAKTYLDNIINSFSQYNLYQYGNSFKTIKSAQDILMNDFIYRNFNEKYKLILNTEELASLYHLPLTSTSTPNIAWLDARAAAAPNNISDEGLVLGENVYRDTKTTIRIKDLDRNRHMYIIGKSGTGKSYFQVNMAVQDIQNGDGVCVLDPHGDLIEDILKYIPKERIEDVILFDPSDTERPLGINMLEFDTQEQKTFVINEILKIFDKLYDLKSTGGPMFEQYMRNAILLIMEDVESGATLLEIPRVLADEEFRKFKLSKCSDYLVKDFWEKQAQKAGGEAALANMVPYITSKLTPFISNDIMRPIISQQKSSFNFREVMDQKKILLINLSKGKIGELNSNLIGMVFVGKILMSALSRTDMPQEERKNFYLYIDEFQNFITDSIAVILSEARKYKLNLTMAHQYISQLVDKGDEGIKDAVFGNVGTFVSFKIGVKDAEIVAKQFAPVFSEYDLINVPAFNAYIKLLIDNHNPPAFSMKTLTRPALEKNYVKEIKELSRLKYGRDKSVVENEIKERMKMLDKKQDLK